MSVWSFAKLDKPDFKRVLACTEPVIGCVNVYENLRKEWMMKMRYFDWKSTATRTILSLSNKKSTQRHLVGLSWRLKSSVILCREGYEIFPLKSEGNAGQNHNDITSHAGNGSTFVSNSLSYCLPLWNRWNARFYQRTFTNQPLEPRVSE